MDWQNQLIEEVHLIHTPAGMRFAFFLRSPGGWAIVKKLDFDRSQKTFYVENFYFGEQGFDVGSLEMPRSYSIAEVLEYLSTRTYYFRLSTVEGAWKHPVRVADLLYTGRFLLVDNYGLEGYCRFKRPRPFDRTPVVEEEVVQELYVRSPRGAGGSRSEKAASKPLFSFQPKTLKMLPGTSTIYSVP
ncbi:hypothetical protein ANO11243_050790 [Dothideomycetidae sp. 11243]|nr:hypothetical protein ANO11243_050790 [fungal sp. No.11243]